MRVARPFRHPRDGSEIRFHTRFCRANSLSYIQISVSRTRLRYRSRQSRYSTVVIWSNPIGSYQEHGLLLGKYLCKDTVNRGALGQLVMDEHQEPLKQRTPLLPTGVPNGVDEAPCSIRYGRQTGQVQQRVGHADQTPMCPNGFGSPQTILVEAQVPLTVLITRVRRPAVRIQADDLSGVPVHAVGHQHDMPSCQCLVLKTD